MAKRTGLDGLANAIEEILAEYSDEIARGTKECVQKAARAGVKALKETSPRSSSNHQHYADGWTSRVDEKRTGATATIYNAKKPGLPHLLEHSHPMRNGTGRTFGMSKPIVHIEPVETQINEAFERDIVEVIQQ